MGWCLFKTGPDRSGWRRRGGGAEGRLSVNHDSWKLLSVGPGVHYQRLLLLVNWKALEHFVRVVNSIWRIRWLMLPYVWLQMCSVFLSVFSVCLCLSLCWSVLPAGFCVSLSLSVCRWCTGLCLSASDLCQFVSLVLLFSCFCLCLPACLFLSTGACISDCFRLSSPCLLVSHS